MEVSFWNESVQAWDKPDFHYIDSDGTLVIYYPWNDDESIYFKEVGKKTKVQVKFL
jgi:hypothetical protein